MYFRKKTSAGRAYLQIVVSRREGAAVRQQVIATLGRIEDLQESGQLERLLRSGARFADKAIVLDALDRGEATTISSRRIGPALAFERVWDSPAVRFDADCIAAVRRAAELAGYPSRDIVSGAGHDSAYIARVAPTTMVFVPCEKGLSHNEAEHAEQTDVVAGANVLLRAVLETDQRLAERAARAG